MTLDIIDRDGLILSADFLTTHSDVRLLTRAAARGELVKLRRGSYVRRELWEQLDSRDRHLMRVRAVAQDSVSPVVLAGYSAAAAHGMPVFEFPDEVHLLERWKGGGRSMPGVRRISAAFPTAHVQSAAGFEVTSIARTALELTRREPFARAVGSMDWALWRRNAGRVTKEALSVELSKLSSQFGVARAERVVAFSSHLSDSYGESLCRALAWELGFAAPRLQRELHDADGLMVPDYSWDDIAVLGEFDGKGKYLRSLRPGEEPGDAVWREKVREDRLRALGFTIVRLVWADLMEPPRLARKLLEVGVPRRR